MWREYLATGVLLIDSPMWMWKWGRFLWNFEADFLKRSLYWDTRAGPLMHELLRIHLMKRLCVGLMSEIEFKTTSHSCWIWIWILLTMQRFKSRDTFVYARSYRSIWCYFKKLFLNSSGGLLEHKYVIVWI